MAFRFTRLLACAALAAMPACGPQLPFIQPPNLLDQLANADLSPRGAPTYSGSDAGTQSLPASRTRAEKYRGNDGVVRRLATAQGIANNGNGYEINFNDASLADLARVVLKDTLEIPYVFDPRVQGRVTLSTGGPVTRTELLSILESVLAINRAALVTDGKLYQIVPDTGGQQEIAGAFDYVQEREEVGPGYGVTIFPLKHVASETMLRMLSSFVAKPGVLRASVHGNLLIIRGTGRERQSLLDVVAMFDVDWMRGQSAGIYTLQNVSPAEMIRDLHRIFEIEGRGRGLIKFQPVERLNAVLVLTQKSAMLDQVDVWVQRLDRIGPEGDNFYVYRVENSKAKELAKILNSTFGGSRGTVRGPEEAEVAPNATASRISSDAPADRGGQPPPGASAEPTAASLDTGRPLDTNGGGSTARAGEVRIIADEENNKLLIKASGRDYERILSILRRIDQPPLQVMINATLAEVTLNDSLKYGVQFYLQKGPKGKDGLLNFTTGPQIDIGPSAPGLNFIIGSLASNPKVILDALATETAVRVVSSPSVVVLHNQTATLQVGDEVPIATRSVVSVIDAQAPIVNEIQFRNTGVILKVTPRVNMNGLITMEIEQEISAVSKSTSVGETGTLTPTISQRRIKSTIAVQSGQMVVLGGLISELMNNDKSRVPVIGKIPYLGDVVGDTQRGKERRELIVFLRPGVIRNPRDASNLAQEMRARMESLAPRPAPWDIEVHPPGKAREAKPFK